MTEDGNAIDPFGLGAIRSEMKRLSILIDEQGIAASFEPNDSPLVGRACECIEEGGDVGHACLASLLHHVAGHLHS